MSPELGIPFALRNPTTNLTTVQIRIQPCSSLVAHQPNDHVSRRRSSLCFVVVLRIFGVSSAQGEDTNTVGKFRSEAPQAWAKLKRGILQGFSVDLKVKWGRPTDDVGGVDTKASNGGEETHRLNIWSGNELIRTAYPVKGVRNGLRVEAINDHYGFSLLKKNPEATGWQVSSIDYNPATRKSKPHGILLGNTIVFYGIMVEGDWLENLVNSKGFEVLSAESVVAEKSAHEFKVTFRSQHTVDRANTILGGTMWFLPGQFWVLSRYDVEIKSVTFGPGWVAKKTTLGRGLARFNYQNLADYPFLKNWIMDYKFEGDPPIRYDDEFGPVSRYEGDASAFTLTAFGIPEPACIDMAAGDRESENGGSALA